MRKSTWSYIEPVLTLTAALVLATAAAAQPAGPPRTSPMAETSQVVGLSKIDVTYSRPSVKGRTVWGELVPWGEVWRTGANEATTFEISHDAEINGKPLPAGTYALFTIPGKDSWTVIFNKEAEQWGAFEHDPAQDVLKIEVAPVAAPHAEMLTVDISEVDADSAVVGIHWAETRVPFTVELDTPAVALAAARADAKDPEKARAMISWASYFWQQGEHLDDALAWASAAAKTNESYWARALEARLQAANGQNEAAEATAARAVELGEKALAEGPNAFVERDMEKLKGEMKEWQG